MGTKILISIHMIKSKREKERNREERKQVQSLKKLSMMRRMPSLIQGERLMYWRMTTALNDI
jgi:hypothetical protein